MSNEELAQRTGLDYAVMDDPDSRITLSQCLKLWQIGIEVTGDPALALSLRKKYGKDLMHFVVILAMKTTSPLEAAQNFCRYAKVVCESDHFEFEFKDDNFILTYSNTSPEHENIWIPEYHLSSAVQFSHIFAGPDNNPIEVRFRHADPGYAQTYREIFKCPVLFAQEKTQLIYNKKVMLCNNISPDPYLEAVLKKNAEAALKTLSKNESFQDRLREFIIKHLHLGTVDVTLASEVMNMDRRTLHRRLKKEGTTFKELLIGIKKELARGYLNQGLTATQIAYLLGFSEPSSFQRAFKRWFGKNPGEFRKKETG
jgi:AraC-like DNA-binding protein